MLRAEADAAGKAEDQRGQQSGQRAGCNGGANERFGRRIRPGVSRAVADYQAHGDPCRREHGDNP